MDRSNVKTRVLDTRSTDLVGHLDVVVLGGGPAGLATAIGLARSGVDVGILSRRRPSWGPVGESLAAASRPLLRELGVLDRFEADGHLPSFGTTSVWGTPDPVLRSSVYDVHGHGWHIDRRAFERRLLDMALTSGVGHAWVEGQARVERRGSRWLVDAPRTGVDVRCTYLVDATGRSSWLARRLGHRRCREDGQLAIVTFFDGVREAGRDSTTLVEAVEDGWWYSAALPRGRLVAAFVTDPDLVDARSGWEAIWSTRLARTSWIGAQVRRHPFRPSGPPRVVAASGGHLPEPAGPGWLAVGDAAMTWDPLAGHGLTAALAGARDAVHAIVAGQGRESAISEYTDRLREARGRYAAARRSIAAQEGRWPDAPFWRRRRIPDA